MGDTAIQKVGVTLALEWDCPCGQHLVERTLGFKPNHEHPADAYLVVYSSHPQCPECGRMQDCFFGVQIMARAMAPSGKDQENA